MDEFSDQMDEAGTALRELAEGPGADAARALEAAFESAGQRIEESLSRAARSGELDFQRMAETILADLARIAAEAVFSSGQGGPAPTINLNLPQAASGEARGVLASQGAISAALARAVASGGRFL
ncbi:MAG: hypothetical protein GVY09_16155 [Gammaproteobacteria bacterium]|jgi:hypothetical protein|nr:hypothetical protein [Gammaproteobacteria bacterium]